MSRIDLAHGMGNNARGTTFWQRHSICSALRTVATARGRRKWEARISGAPASELPLIAQELRALAVYSGKIIFRLELTRKGIKEADALRGLAHARIIKEEIEPFFAQLKFPFARNKGEASAVMSSIGEALGKMLADEPEAADAGGEALLGIILERKFKEKLRVVFTGQAEMVDPTSKAFQDRQDPALLVKEYHDLDLGQKLNLVALEGSVSISRRKSPLPLPDDRFYDPQKVIVAIDNGAVTKLIHIVRAGRKREFLS